MKFYQNWTLCGRRKGTDIYSPKFPATVPGNAQWDYACANGMENFAFNDGVRAFDEIEDYEWNYETILDFENTTDEKIYFIAEGIDYQFDILLDGKVIHSQEGMYTKVELDITGKATKGSKLEVFVYAPPKREDAPSGSRNEADRSCKPPVTYGWDWNPRLIISGIWKPAYIETRRMDYIYSCEPFYTLNDDRTEATVWFQTTCAKDVIYTVWSPDNKIIYHGTEPFFTVKNVQLWWCNGQGDAALYTWTARSDSDEKKGHIGFRTIRLVHNEGADDVTGYPKTCYPNPITIELNGRRIFAKGSNWVNPDVFFGRITDEVYKTQVALTKEANMNIFRCWGGAGINKECFYEECDKNGIMVWQEFMLACNNYIGEPHYLKILEQEAVTIIKSLRRYPSLVIWGGGNELFNGWSGMDNQSAPLRLLDKLCFELDPQKPFLMTSPIYGMAHGGYTFFDYVDEQCDVLEKFIHSHNTAYTEFGVPSIASFEDLKTIIPEHELFPIKDTPAWRLHHGFGAWLEDTWVCSGILDKYFGTDESLEERIRHSNWLQCTGYKAIFEEARRQWGACSMAINWCYNEPWLTAAGNSLLSYPSKKKPAYYAVKESLRTVLTSARIPKFDWNGNENFTAQIWYLNDGVKKVSDTVQISIRLGEKEFFLLTWETGEVPANTNKLGPAVNFKLPPNAETNELELVLSSKAGRGSEYKLLFKNGRKPLRTKIMNI